jgi:putative RNA 2'-phosphotransferase
MENRNIIKRSKRLSRILRHDPAAAGLTLEEGGWVLVEDLLTGLRNMRHPMTRSELDEVVEKNDKKRYVYSECGTKIRAAQGHSVEVDLQLQPMAPPDVLLHGTAAHNVEHIFAKGLLPMGRSHVHLSVDIETATKVGRRHGKPVIFEIDAAGMSRAEMDFFVADNGVWLTRMVPPNWLTLVGADK